MNDRATLKSYYWQLRQEASSLTLDDLTLRSTFIVGFPGETEAEFGYLLDWLDAAQLDRVGCFRYENVAGARANALPDHVREPVKQERWERFMAKTRAISAARLAARVGTRVEVIVDEVDYLRVYVRRLRDKLGDDPARPRYIRTERGLGYRFLTPSEAGPIDLSASEEESPGGAEK